MALYYFSNAGNDTTGNGSIGTPYATLSKASSITLVAGDSVLFKCGDTFRGTLVIGYNGTASSAITYSSYGTGNKPLLLGSKDGSNSSDWVSSGGTNMWATITGYTSNDIGNLIFNNEASYGFGKVYLTGCTTQGDFYFNEITRKLYLYSVSNPGTFYSHIEVGGAYSDHIIPLFSHNYINISNFDIRYSSWHGIDVYQSNYCIIENCDFSWIGGSFAGMTDGTRLGNAIQLWNTCSNIIIRNNKISQVYDAGITPQGSGTYLQSDIWIYNNLIKNCWYSYEVFEYAGASMTNVNFDNNTCIDAGVCWSALQRPSKTNERHVMWWGAEGTVIDCHIRNNIFSGITDANQALRFDAACHASLSNNLYYVTNIARLGYPTPITYSTLSQWQIASTGDTNSISANPLFISSTDFRLQTGSTARNAGIDIGLPYAYSAPDIGANETGFYYMSPNGSNSNVGSWENPWLTLYYATTQVTLTGSTIYIKAGTYNEPNRCYLSVGVSIIGDGDSSNIICTNSANTSTYGCISLYSYPTQGTNGNQSISYVKLDGSNLTGFAAIVVYDRSNVKIHHVTIVNFLGGAIGFKGGCVNSGGFTGNIGAPPTTWETGNEIYNSTITNCGTRTLGFGNIHLDSQSGFLFHDNIADQTARPDNENGNIISCWGAYIKGLKIYNNKFYKPLFQTTAWNFVLEGGTTYGGNEVYNNEFHNGTVLDIAAWENLKGDFAYSWWIHDNLFQMDRRITLAEDTHLTQGVAFEATNEYAIVNNNHFINYPTAVSCDLGQAPRFINNIRIYNNLCENMGHSNSSWAWTFQVASYISGNTIENLYYDNNTIISSGTTGAFYISCSDLIQNVYIRNNIIQNVVGYGWITFWGTGIIRNVYSQNNNLYNNINSNAPYYNGGQTVTNFVQTNNITTNPLFVSTKDFRLQSGSPAINKGIDVGLPYTGTAPDIGAFEYGSIYFDNILGNDSGSGTTISPYKSITKLNSILSAVNTGTTIYLKRGSEWSGSGIIFTKSGTVSNPIVLDAYGTGENPIISGFATLTGWTLSGANIYYVDIASQSSINMVLVDGVQYGVGRFPKSSWMTISARTGTTKLTSASLTGATWIGAEAIIKGNPYITDKCFVTNQVGTTITYVNSGTSTTVPPVGYGFFLQNDLKCLSQSYDWAYKGTRFYMYFADNNPSGHIIKVSVIDKIINNNGYNYITFNNLNIKGGNKNGIYCNATAYNIVSGCSVNFIGDDGIYFDSNHGLIDSNTITNINQIGIYTADNFISCTNNILYKIGTILGSAWKSSAQLGIFGTGTDNLFKYNDIRFTGYNGIYIAACSRTIVDSNFISDYCIISNDGGGIYTAGTTNSGRTISNNIIVNGIGSTGGTTSSLIIVEGIYIDEPTFDIKIFGNTCAYSPYSGLKLHNTRDMYIYGNTFYNNGICSLRIQENIFTCRNNVITGNTMSIHTGELFLKHISDQNDLGLNATFNYNHYINPLGVTNLWETGMPTDGTKIHTSFTSWKAYVSGDTSSTYSGNTEVKFEYNSGKTNLVIPLSYNYITADGTNYNMGSITLQPYTSAVLMKTGNLTSIYFDSIDGNDSGSGTTISPYKSITKLNSILTTVTTGTTIYLKRGSVWTGSTITPTKSGTALNPISIDAYGTGENPIISGFQTISGWIQSGTTGIWYKVIAPQSIPNMVTVDNVNTPLGRFPKTGYLTIDAFTGKTAISSSSLNSTLTGWTGAELVIRKNRYIIQRCPILNHTGNKITYTSLFNSYDAIVGYGFFIQNDIKCLTQLGDWFYTGGTFYMYFGVNNPINYTVKISVLDELLVPSNHIDYLNIKNLTFEGANIAAIHTYYNDFFNLDSCSILYSGRMGYHAQTGGWYGTVNNCLFNYSNHLGLRIAPGTSGSGYTITNNTILNTGTLAGMGIQPPGPLFISSDFVGISLSCHNSLVENNHIDTCGYIGIQLAGDKGGMIINKNFINNYLTLTDDGGAIYTWINSYNNHTNCYITNNIITNGIGNHDGVYTGHTTYIAQGIYLDNYSENYIVSGNTCAYSVSGGIFLGLNAKNCEVKYNTSFNNRYQLWSIGQNEIVSRGFTITDNIFFASTTSQYMTLIDATSPNLLGTVDYNYWCRPINENNSFWMSNPTYHYESLAQWKTAWGLDTYSNITSTSITNISQIKFEYNTGSTNSTIILNKSYMKIDGTVVNNVTLSPFTSIILLDVFSPIYFDSISGNDSGSGTTISPYKSISKLNSILSTVNTGTTIYLKRGSEWIGTITPGTSGTLANPITIDAYDTGSTPKITGFISVTGWTNLGSNIWESSSGLSSLTTCNIVKINGINTPMGRVPNTGYYTIQSHSGNTSITSTNLSGATNWTGADVVIRKNNWTLQRATIISQSGITINYIDQESGTFSPQDNWGFFIQDDSKTLDTQNDWYFNPSTKKIRIYSTTQPTDVKVPIFETLVDNTKNYITFNNLKFEGANTSVISIIGSTGTTINNCDISYGGFDGINNSWSSNSTIENNTITQCNDIGIKSATHTDYDIIRYNIIDYTSMIPGICKLNAPGAIYIGSPHSLVQYNNIDHSGYNGIYSAGNYVEIRNNFINNSLLNRNDGGGIYPGGDNVTTTIDGNIVLNTFGDTGGTYNTTIMAEGIYLDINTINTTVTNNTSANNGDSGLFLNYGNHTNTVSGNIFYNNAYSQIMIHDYTGTGSVYNNVINNNMFISKDITQYTLEIRSAINDIPSFIISNNNYYARPIDDNKTIRAGQPDQYSGGLEYKTLLEWQLFSTQDGGSLKSPMPISGTSQLRFEYNSGLTSRTVTLGSTNYMLMNGLVVTGSLTLAPYTSVILMEILNVPSGFKNLIFFDVITKEIKFSTIQKIYFTI